MNEEQSQKYYALLNQKQTELRAIIPEKGVEETTHVDKQKDFLTFCNKWSGKANVYAGIHERKRGGTLSKDVNCVKLIALDIDVPREKNTAATEEELKKCKEFTNDFLDEYETKFGKASVVMTGNGFQVIWKIKPILLDDKNRLQVEKKIKAFIDQLKDKYNSSKVGRFDQIGDLARILKVAGTLSIKGDNTKERPHREAFFVHFEPWESDALRDYLLLLEVEEETTTTTTSKEKKISSKDTSRSAVEYRYCCQLIRKGLTREEVYSELHNFGGKWCTSPEAYKEITYEKALAFVEKTKPKKKGKIVSTNYGLTIDNFWDNAQKFYDVQPYFYDANQIFWFWDENEHKYDIKDETDIMLLFDETLGFAGQTVNNKVKSLTLEAMRRFGRKIHPKDAPKKWVQFKDKAYSLTSGKLYDVTPDYYFVNPIPWELGKSEETPIMDKLFTEWVGKTYVPTLYEILAYCCYTDYPIHSAICLIGSGRNGKSSFLKILDKLIGEDNITSSDLELLSGQNRSRFESFRMFKKLACTLGETNFSTMNNSKTFKELTGSDRIGFEIKGKTGFTGFNYAKIIIATNSMPTSEDTSEGFYRRWLIIDFSNNFPEGSDITKTIPEQEYHNLSKKCCRVLKELLDRGSFTNHGTIKERKDKYIMASNPLPFFLKKYCEEKPDGHVRYSELYSSYAHFLTAMNRRVVSKREFSKTLESEGYEIRRTTITESDIRITDRFIFGISLLHGLNVRYSGELDKMSLDASDHYIPTRLSWVVEGVGDHAIKGIKRHQHYEPIHQNCHICGLTPCAEFVRGKPICEFCLEGQKKEFGIDLEDEDV